MELAEMLLHAAADPAAGDEVGATAAHYAAQYNQSGLLEWLVQRTPALVNAVDTDNRAPITWAISKNSGDAVKTLIDAGADLTVPDSEGRRAMHIAAFANSAELVKVIAENVDPAELNAQDSSGHSALISAAELGHTEVVTALLANPEIDITIVDHESKTALHHAAIGGHYTVIHELLRLVETDDDANPVDDRYETPVHYACFYGHADVLAELLENSRVQFDLQDIDGVSPLHWAVQQNHPELVRYLLTYQVSARVLLGHY